MSNDLFTIPEQPSPRLQWLRRYNVTTNQDENGKWTATGASAEGDTEHDAIVSLAIKNGWRLWNETTP